MHYKKGVVVSAKGDKTVVVLCTQKKMHSKYRKYFTTSSKYYAHDQENRYKEGDDVTIRLVRPISKMKRWLCIPEGSIDKLKKQGKERKEKKEKKKDEIVKNTIAKMKEGSQATKVIQPKKDNKIPDRKTEKKSDSKSK